MSLAQYFRTPYTIQALDRYARFAGGEKNWGIGNKLRL